MTTTPRKALRESRIQQIDQCTRTVAEFFNADPIRILRGHITAASDVDARNVLWRHLHSCGMSYRAIGRLSGRADSTVREGVGNGLRPMLSPAVREMVAKLPRIGNSLTITHAEP